MAKETLGLKNVNLLTKEQYTGIAEPAKDELYAVEAEVDNSGYPTSEVTIIEDTTWVATDNGFACATGTSSAADNNLLTVYNTTTLMGNGCGSWIQTNFYVSIPVSKGDVVTFTASRISGLSMFFVKGK